MKKIIVKSEVVVSLQNKLSAFCSKTNAVRMVIGMKNLGDSLASSACIVNGGQMGQIGFSTNLPDDDVSAVSEASPYMAFNLNASHFCGYLSKLKEYNSDICIAYDGVHVTLSVGEMVSLELDTIADENVEPLLNQSFEPYLAKFIIKGEDFLKILQKGGYAAGTTPDTMGIDDRFVMKLSKDKAFAYSTDRYIVSKSWCNARVEFSETERATQFLRMKGSELDNEGKHKMWEEICKAQQTEGGILNYAIEQGFKAGTDVWFSVPGSAYSNIIKLFTGVEDLLFVVTPECLHIKGGNVLATYALAGDFPSLYEKTVDNVWCKRASDAKVVVDKDELIRALDLLRLGCSDGGSFRISYDGSGISVGSKNNVIHIAVVAQDGNVSGIGQSFHIGRMLNGLSKLSGGNVALDFMTMDDKNTNPPIAFYNGGVTAMDGDGVDSNTFLAPMKDTPTEKSTSDSEKKTKE